MGCTSVRDVGCFVCTALLSFYMWIQSASFPILSRGNVNKHVYCGGTFVACSSPQHQPKQCGEGGTKMGRHTHPCRPRGLLHTVYPRFSCARTIGEFLSKQEARKGPKRLQHSEEDRSLSNEQPVTLSPSVKKLTVAWRGETKTRLYLFPSVEEALLLRAYIEDVLYFQA